MSVETLNTAYGRDFQDKLISLLLRKKSFRFDMAEFLEESYFDEAYAKMIFQRIALLNSQHNGSGVSQTSMRIELERHCRSINTDSRPVLEKLDELFEMPDDEDSGFIESETRQFIVNQRLDEAMLEASEYYAVHQRYDVEATLRKLKELEIVDPLETVESTFYFRDMRRRVTDFYSTLDYGVDRVTTGFRCLDEPMFGGLKKKNIGIIVGTTSGGKSMVLANFAKNIALAKKKVVYLSLEMNVNSLCPRIDSMLSGLTLQQSAKKPRKVLNALNTYIEDLDGGEIYVAYMRHGTCSLHMIDRLLKRLDLRHGFKADALIVDYPELMKMDVSKMDYRFQVAYLCRQLKDIGEQYDIPVWVASQTNRDGEEKLLVTLKYLAEAYEKAAVSDVVITLCPDPADRQVGKLKMLIAKNREGPAGGFFSFNVDFSLTKIWGGIPVPLPKAKSRGRSDE